MKKKQNHINSYTAADIRDYLDGKLSREEMHAMEKAAMDDPMLSDAMEGMEPGHAQNPSFESAAEDLAKRLQDRIHQKDKKAGIQLFMRRWQVAAAVLILIGAGVLSYLFLINNKPSALPVALNKEKSKTTDSALIDDRFEAPKQLESDKKRIFKAKETTAPNKASSGTKNSDNATAPPEEESEKIKDLRKVSVPPPEAFSARNNKPEEIAASIENKKPTASSAPDIVLQGRAAGVIVKDRKVFSKSDNSRHGFYLQGIVTDTNGVPIPDASVKLKNRDGVTSTDQNGIFKLNTASPDSAQQVVINAIGYEQASATLRPANHPEHPVQLKQSPNTLADVVVVGYGTRKKEDSEDGGMPAPARRKAAPAGAEPVAGWAAYNNYISKNKKISTADSLLKGVEIVSFIVHKKGALSAFKIEKSLSPAHDTEVIRLIKEGPAWKLNGGNRHRCRLTVNFY